MPVSRPSAGSEKYVKVLIFNKSIRTHKLNSLCKLATTKFNYPLVPSLKLVKFVATMIGHSSPLFYEFSD